MRRHLRILMGVFSLMTGLLIFLATLYFTVMPGLEERPGVLGFLTDVVISVFFIVFLFFGGTRLMKARQ